MQLRFTVPGAVVSNNFTARNVGGRMVKSAAAKEYQARVQSVAWAAMRFEQWEPGDSVSVIILAIGQRCDIDNIPKSILDGMKGAVYGDDRCVTHLTVIRKPKDGSAPRVEVTVTAAGSQ